MTEPGAGSDLRGMQATAIESGGDFVLNGTKHFISHAEMADFVIAFMASGEGSTVDLRWTAPSGAAVATEYIIEAGSAPGRSDLAVLRVGNVTHFSTQAPPGVYYVRVRGVNASGVGAASNEVIVRR